MSDLRPLTVYLPEDEVIELEREAAKAGRGGVSAQIRWILAQLRREA